MYHWSKSTVSIVQQHPYSIVIRIRHCQVGFSIAVDNHDAFKATKRLPAFRHPLSRINKPLGLRCAAHRGGHFCPSKKYGASGPGQVPVVCVPAWQKRGCSAPRPRPHLLRNKVRIGRGGGVGAGVAGVERDVLYRSLPSQLGGDPPQHGRAPLGGGSRAWPRFAGRARLPPTTKVQSSSAESAGHRPYLPAGQ